MNEYEEIEKEFRQLQERASKLISNSCFDSINLDSIHLSVLRILTNANSSKDISPYIWNTGTLPKTLDYISDKIKKVAK